MPPTRLFVNNTLMLGVQFTLASATQVHVKNHWNDLGLEVTILEERASLELGQKVLQVIPNKIVRSEGQF